METSAANMTISHPLVNTDTTTSFALQFGVSLGVVSLVVVIIMVSYLFYSRKHIQTLNISQHGSSDDQDSITIQLGLDELTINGFPKVQYSKSRKTDKGDDSSSTIAISCSICLADYKESDMVRLIPNCDHMFHLQCIDLWLKFHTTCPLCRSSPSPSAEAVPVTRRREF